MMAYNSMKKWIVGWLTLTPHFIVGGVKQPYLKRWYIIPRNTFFNIYLHQFLRDDDDRALHDHPSDNLSIILRGSYIEHLTRGAKVQGRWGCGKAVRDYSTPHIVGVEDVLDVVPDRTEEASVGVPLPKGVDSLD